MMESASAAALVFGRVATSLGTQNFHRTVLDVMRQILPSDFAQVYHIDRSGRAVCLDPCDTPEDYCRSYEAVFSLDCPLSRYWQKTARPGVVTLAQVRDDREHYGTYFSEFYEPTGLVDEIGLMLPSPGRNTVALFLERTSKFSDEAAKSARQFFGGITRLHRVNNHLMLSTTMNGRGRGAQPNAVQIIDRFGNVVFANRAWRLASHEDKSLERSARADCAEITDLAVDQGQMALLPLDAAFPIAPGGRMCILAQDLPGPRMATDDFKRSFLTGQISKREHDVVCLILDGHPTRVIADKLNCAVETVKAHRKRLFQRLDITTEREIFLMFVQHMQQHGRAIH